MQNINNLEKDQLVEIINIGAGNASTALSQMIAKKIEINVPKAYIDKVEKISQFIGRSEKIMTVILLKILGDAPGTMLLIFDPKSALKLASQLTKRPKKDIQVLDEIDRSALREVGNIISGASMTALSNFLGLNILQSVPESATDMLGAVLDSILADIGQNSETVLVFEVNFSVINENINGQLFFLFDPKSTAKILEITKKKVSNA